MKAKLSILFAFSIAMAALALWLGLAGSVQGVQAAPIERAAADPAAVYATIITVTSGTDPDTSDSRTCITYSPCTLRRAVIQARGATKPVLIAFNIPKTSVEGYNDGLKIWKIEFSGESSAANATLRYLTGQITIDGNTQAGGRTTGPKIILVGDGTGQNDGLKLGESGSQDSNVIRGLGFQNFKTHIYVNSSNNIVENNWFGLNDTGDAPFLRQDNPADGSGNTGVSISSGAEQNTLQNNVFLGLAGVSVSVSGNHNRVANNYIGTAANGTVPGKVTDLSQLCQDPDWLGGGGINISGVVYSGVNNVVENNIIAGLRQKLGLTITTPPEAIAANGSYHLIQNNKIGVDKNGTIVGVCGRGIYLTPSPHDMKVLSNTIANTGMSAISLNGVLYDAVLLRNNTVRQDGAWGVVEGNAVAEDAIQLGKTLPNSLRLFKNSIITSISGTTVYGAADSACANCIIELFLDDTDAITEALKSLAVVTADANGNWTAHLPTALTEGQAIRTTSTTPKFGTMAGLDTNTTSGLSKFYEPITPPNITIANASTSEGNSGTKNLTFTVSLSAPAKQQITVDYATSNGSATAGSDYTAKNGTLVFEIGDQTKTIAIVILGDTNYEANETFTVTLSDAVNGVITDATATGTITNDDSEKFNIYLPVLIRNTK